MELLAGLVATPGTAGDNSGPTSPEERLASKELLSLLLQRLHQELTPLGRDLFELLYVAQTPIETVCEQRSMSPDAVYAWRSRLTRCARRIMDEILSEPAEKRQYRSMGGRR